MKSSKAKGLGGGVTRRWLAPAVFATGLTGLFGVVGVGCQDAGKVSAAAAKAHLSLLVEASVGDVQEVRDGLPVGAKHLASLWSAPEPAASAAVAELGREPGAVGSAAPVASAPPAAGSAAVPSGSGVGSALVPPAVDAAAPAAPPAPAASAVTPPVVGSAALGTSDDAATAVGAPVGSAGEAGATSPPPIKTAALSVGPDAPTARAALFRARNKVQDLRVAKSTFFALADARGIVLRNDQDQDLMVGKGLFESFPELRQALKGRYVESRGSMPEAAGIGNQPDAQWVAAAPVMVGGQVRGLYVTGWSWSAYAKRLQNAVRGVVREELAAGKNEPLVYVVVVVGDQAYGWEAPEVNVRAVADFGFIGRLAGDQPATEVFELTGRRWGAAAQLTPALGEGVAVAILRSET